MNEQTPQNNLYFLLLASLIIQIILLQYQSYHIAKMIYSPFKPKIIRISRNRRKNAPAVASIHKIPEILLNQFLYN